ncbi:hypothetical protein KJ359_008035 [Pestalotiopsis sp. 9143b]|nr:hypothetical protein KJ359_008035 [Pestalotiopsis sp. 9143b]
MAPPPPANLPLQERLLALAKTLQFGWFTGHLVLLISIFRYSLSFIRFNYYSKTAQTCYRLSFVAAAVTYGIVIYKTFRARQKVGARYPAGAVGLLSDENVQYFAMALVWLFTPQYPLALLPYGIYSVFHVATYTRANVIPTVAPAQGAAPGTKASSPIADAIGNFVKTYYDMSMSVVSALEVLLWLRLFIAAILFQRRSWILLVLYTAFVRARFAQSSHVQSTVGQATSRIDAAVGNQGTSPYVRQAWDSVKAGGRSFHDATDISRYTNGGAVPKKTS